MMPSADLYVGPFNTVLHQFMCLSLGLWKFLESFHVDVHSA